MNESAAPETTPRHATASTLTIGVRSASTRARRVSATAIAAAALLVLVGSSTFRECEASLASAIVGMTVAPESLVAVSGGEPSVAFRSGQIWLALPFTAELSAAYALAALALGAAALLWFSDVTMRRVVTVLAASLLAVLAVFQLQYVAIAGVWSLIGTDEYYASRPWLTAGAYVVAVLIAIAGTFALSPWRVRKDVVAGVSPAPSPAA